MPYFSQSSKAKLETCHYKIRLVMEKVIKFFDVKITCGVRSDEDQAKAFQEGRSKLDGVNKKSKHQADRTGKSRAIDIAPYPVDYDLRKPHIMKRWYYMGGFVMGVAFSMGINMRWGGDWDSDTLHYDQTFNDLPHFELVDE